MYFSIIHISVFSISSIGCFSCTDGEKGTQRYIGKEPRVVRCRNPIKIIGNGE